MNEHQHHVNFSTSLKWFGEFWRGEEEGAGIDREKVEKQREGTQRKGEAQSGAKKRCGEDSRAVAEKRAWAGPCCAARKGG